MFTVNKFGKPTAVLGTWVCRLFQIMSKSVMYANLLLTVLNYVSLSFFVILFCVV